MPEDRLAKIYGAWIETEAKFLVPDQGMQSILAEGCRTGPPGYIGWRAEPYAIVDNITQSGTQNLASELLL